MAREKNIIIKSKIYSQIDIFINDKNIVKDLKRTLKAVFKKDPLKTKPYLGSQNLKTRIYQKNKQNVRTLDRIRW